MAAADIELAQSRLAIIHDGSSENRGVSVNDISWGQLWGVTPFGTDLDVVCSKLKSVL